MTAPVEDLNLREWEGPRRDWPEWKRRIEKALLQLSWWQEDAPFDDAELEDIRELLTQVALEIRQHRDELASARQMEHDYKRGFLRACVLLAEFAQLGNVGRYYDDASIPTRPQDWTCELFDDGEQIWLDGAVEEAFEKEAD